MIQKILKFHAVTLFVLIFITMRSVAADETIKKGAEQKNAQDDSSGIAISLKVIQKKIKECVPKNDCDFSILNLCGATRIFGFVIDSENSDLILIGKKDENLPPLFLEDLVVSLRKEWERYRVVKKGVEYIDMTPAGCSIDPFPEVIKALSRVLDVKFDIFNPEHVAAITQRWNETCELPQKVRVDGIPYDTRFARVMVEADYLMKRIVDGSIDLGIDGLKSLTQMSVQSFGSRGSKNMFNQTMNRFWFSPGENSFVRDAGAAYIKKSEVILLTEEQYITQKNELADIGRKNSLAEKFSNAFTQKYQEIKKVEPIYEELEGLFRFVALVKLIRHEKAVSRSGIDIEYLLSKFPVKEVKNDRIKAGIPMTRMLESPNRRQFYRSCGGVTTNMVVDESSVALDRSGRLMKTRQSVLSYRPSLSALYWNFLNYLIKTDSAKNVAFISGCQDKSVFRMYSKI